MNCYLPEITIIINITIPSKQIPSAWIIIMSYRRELFYYSPLYRWPHWPHLALRKLMVYRRTNFQLLVVIPVVIEPEVIRSLPLCLSISLFALATLSRSLHLTFSPCSTSPTHFYSPYDSCCIPNISLDIPVSTPLSPSLHLMHSSPLIDFSGI